MEVAQYLAHWRGQSPEQWLRAANRFLPQTVTTVLVLAIAYEFAALTWSLVPGGTPSGALPVVTPAASRGGTASNPSSTFASLPAAHLFGEAPDVTAAPVVEQPVVDAPDTTLSLRLTGILYGEGGATGGAIISNNRGQEKTYQIGQAIDGANGATLHSVYADRVILSRDGRLETLRLPKQTVASTAASRIPAAPLPTAPPVPVQPPPLRQMISENAARLTEIFRLAPHVEQGQVVGFRVNPGRDRATFDALGLVPGDIVTEINGQVLDDPAVGLQIFETLGDSTMANVTVIRDGVPQVVVVDTNAIQNELDLNQEATSGQIEENFE